ncbi:MAG TPA: hypothetical protein VLT83_15735 [Opitutaceae bacterium]|nr:hypothetical protein [Opitutaceae bacterium]
MTNPEHPSPSEIQALVFSGHSGLPWTAALWLRVAQPAAARRALGVLASEHVAFGLGGGARKRAVQVLLSAAGLRVLGIPGAETAPATGAFWQGMAAPQRSRALGDLGANAPAKWSWSDRDTHALVLIYAAAPEPLQAERATVEALLAPGWSVAGELALHVPSDGREPFGFSDGLVRMRLDLGDGRPAEPGVDVLAPGEILPGYRDANGVVTPAPALVRDGTYVAVRQLEQDIAGFWRFWRSQAADDEEAVWLAAKAVGRWPNGMPATGSAPQPPPERHPSIVSGRLTFAGDLRGEQCPAGAHIRRANPRDGLTDDPAASLTTVARRRLLRRGRRYGPPADASWYPDAARPGETVRGAAAESRGLLFIALCADLARQFEFVQQTWLNNPKFHGLNNEVDPIAAGDGLPDDGRRFSIPRNPLRRRVCGLQKWVTVRGGGYYLLPGRQTLAALAGGDLDP